MNKVFDWVKKNRFEAFLLSLILLTAAFLRLYKIDEYMTFLGDEGRDVIVVRRLLVNFDPILVGPGTSIGNMYLGPLYYYLMAPFLFLADFSPAGPAVMIALLGLATVFMVWYMGREWFGKLAGFISASLYAVSPVVITYSRSSWNPNIMPFFSLLSIYSIWRVFNKREFGWLPILGISFAFVLNSHYLGLLLLPVLGIFWLITLFSFNKIKPKSLKEAKKSFFVNSVIGVFLFLLLMSPLFIFDARHGWRNLSAIKVFFTDRQATVSARPWTSIPKIIPLSEKITSRLMAGMNTYWGNLLNTLLLISGILLLARIIRFFVIQKKLKGSDESHDWAYLLIILWLGMALIGLGAYKQEIYDHYYGFFFTAPYLLLGGIIQDFTDFIKKRRLFIKVPFYILLFTAFIFLLYLNISANPLRYPPNRQLQKTEEISKKIVDEAQGKTFNLAVIAERNYEGAYQYFLEKWNAPLIMIDPQRSGETITGQLFVVCELPYDKCDPTHNPKAGIANFGWSKIDGQWNIEGIILFRLIHSK